MTLSERMRWLQSKGCTPSVYLRGDKLYRAHVNAAGNFWADAKTPKLALEEATRLWHAAGCPLDGTAQERVQRP